MTSTIYTSDLVGLARLVTKADFECGPHQFKRKEKTRTVTPHHRDLKSQHPTPYSIILTAEEALLAGS